MADALYNTYGPMNNARLEKPRHAMRWSNAVNGQCARHFLITSATYREARARIAVSVKGIVFPPADQLNDRKCVSNVVRSTV